MRLLIFTLLFYFHLPLSAQYISKAIDFQDLLLSEAPLTIIELDNGDFILETNIREVNEYGGVGLSRISSMGDIIWEMFVDSLQINNSIHTILMNDGTILIAGKNLSDTPEPSMRFIHFDDMGNILNQFFYGEELDNELLFRIIKLEEGFIAVVFLPSDTEYDKPHLIRFSEIFEIIWENSYDALFTTSLFVGDIYEDEDGNIYAGGSAAAGGPKRRPMMIKLDAQGEEIWRFYDPKYSYNCSGGILPTSNGSVFLTGCLHQSEHNEPTTYYSNPMRVVKVTESGEQLSEKNLFRYSLIDWNARIFKENGTYICAGLGHGEEYDTENFEMPTLAAFIGSYDSEFNLLWERFIIDERYSSIPNSFSRMIQAQNGDLVLVGYAYPEIAGSIEIDTWFVRTDSLGCLEPNCGFLQTIDEDGNYGTLTATEDIQQNPTNPLSVQISPNPAREQITVSLLGKQPKIQTLTLVDVQGRIVKEYDTTFISAEFNLDIPREVKGMCYLRALTEAGVWVKKIVVE